MVRQRFVETAGLMLATTLIYAVAALLSVAVAVLLFAGRREVDVARRAGLAAAVGAAWAIVLAVNARVGEPLGWGTLLAEGLRYGAWIVTLHPLLPPGGSRWLKRFSMAAVATPVLLATYGLLAEHLVPVPSLPGGWFGIAAMLPVLAGLVTTEQVIRAGATTHARAIRLCAAGIGGFFAYDLFLYSQALLLGQLDLTAWMLRGVVASLLLLPITAGVWRLPVSTLRMFISRHVVFYTTTFVAVGLYLCLMAFGGYYVRERGGSWGNALQVVFLGGAAAVLISLLLSESPLRRMRVFIATHFYRNKYDYRVEWLRFVKSLSLGDDPDKGRTAVHAIARIFGCERGLLLSYDEDSRSFNLQSSWPEGVSTPDQLTALPADATLVQFLSRRGWVIDLREYRLNPQIYGNLELPAWLNEEHGWRVVSPLFLGEQLFGILMLAGAPEPFSMNFEDRDLLKVVGRNVAVHLAQSRADARLAESRQFDAFNRFTAFVMHDLKNSVAQLQLLVANAARHRNNPEFVDDAVGTIRNTTERMTHLIEQLQSRNMQGTARPVEVGAIAALAAQRGRSRRPPVTFEPAAEEIFVHADPDRLGAVLDHALRNAQEATPEAGSVTLQVQSHGDQVWLIVTDTGAGMDERFVRDRLFKPFDSTKGSKGMGIGAYQMREYVRSVGGEVEVQSAPGRGTRFCIRLKTCPKRSPSS